MGLDISHAALEERAFVVGIGVTGVLVEEVMDDSQRNQSKMINL